VCAVRGLVAWAAVAALAAAAAAPALADAPTTVPRTGVLVLHSYHEGLTWTDRADQGIRETLAARTDIEVYTEYLDAKRFTQDEHLDLFVRYLARKYEASRIALVIVSDNNALAFATHYRKELFAGVPISFCGIDDLRPSLLAGLDAPVTGVVQALDPLGTIELIRTLQPDLRRLVVVSGIDTTAVAIRHQTRAATEQLVNPPDIEWLSGPSTRELVERLRELTPDDAALICNFNHDADGVYYSHEDAARLISGASGAPVYAMQDLYLGTGVVGGSVISSRDQGRLAARLGLETLDTGEVQPISWDCPNVVVCDHSAMARFDLDESRLPAGVEIVNRPTSFYDRHRRLIWSAALTFALLCLALAGVTYGLVRARQIGRALRRSEDKLRTTLNSIGDAVVATDVTGRIVHLNPVAERLTGWTAAEALHQPLAAVVKLVDTQTGSPVVIPVAEVLQSGEIFAHTSHTALIARDGAEYRIAETEAPIRADDDTITGVVLVFRDVTDEVRMRRRLVESDEQMELALRGADLGTWDWDVGGDTVAVSARSAEILGESRGGFSAPAADLWQRVHPADQLRVRAALDAHLRGEAASYESEHRLRRGENEWTWVLDRGRVIARAPDGTPLRMCGTHRDITDRKRAESEREKLAAQLRQAQRMESIGLLAGGIAHDFNNILTAISGNAELAASELEARFPLALDARDSLQEIEHSVIRGANLTRQLLAFSRRQVIRPVVLDLNATLLDLKKMLDRLISESITLRLHCAPELARVEADPGQIEQVIVNLVVNARDAMPGGGCLDLATGNVTVDEAHVAAYPDCRPGRYVLLTVSDTGCGIDGATRERLFDPFFTTKSVGQGTGLGLATVYGIVKQAGGFIAVYSEPGRGATFKIYWPATSAHAVVSGQREAIDTSPSGTETVLTCEDDPAVREITARILRNAGYTVHVARDSADALQLAAAVPGRLDLLITDVIMPGLNGRELAEALVAQRPTLRTLFVSGYASNVIAHHGMLEPGVEFLEKPFSRQQLLQRVREVMSRAPAGPRELI